MTWRKGRPKCMPSSLITNSRISRSWGEPRIFRTVRPRFTAALINEILSFSSLEHGRAELELEDTDLRTLVEEVVDMLPPLAGRKDVALEMELPAGSVSLQTDAHKLRQILLNLLGNAIKFTDDGTVTGRVATEVQDAVITVHDTGCGIAARDIERIFHPFWQAEQSRIRSAEGTGLGLAVARRLAHLLAGDITVESLPGDGSKFTLRLPWRYPRNRRESTERRTADDRGHIDFCKSTYLHFANRPY